MFQYAAHHNNWHQLRAVQSAHFCQQSHHLPAVAVALHQQQFNVIVHVWGCVYIVQYVHRQADASCIHRALKSIIQLFVNESQALIIGTHTQQNDNFAQLLIEKEVKLYSFASITVSEVMAQDQSLQSQKLSQTSHVAVGIVYDIQLWIISLTI